MPFLSIKLNRKDEAYSHFNNRIDICNEAYLLTIDEELDDYALFSRFKFVGNGFVE